MYNRSVKPFLTTRSLSPENQESPLHFLSNPIISSEYFFLRNHFDYPSLKEENFFLTISGEVTRPYTFHLYDLLQMPKRKVFTVLECAGNKRSKFEPKVYGEQWENGAISQGLWEGVALSQLIQYTGLTAKGREFVFEGHDFGEDKSKGKTLRYERSLPLTKALHEDTIIAYKYNNSPISLKHGAPFRLIVPQWYGMASIKWVKSIKVIDYAFHGTYQTDDYVYYPYLETDVGAEPVTIMNVNSTIQQPLHYTTLKKGVHKIRGIAWTGLGSIEKVEVSFDQGRNWTMAELQPSSYDYSWATWEYDWKAMDSGEYKILSRATDSHHRQQPMQATWNRKGYGFHAAYVIQVNIV